LDHQNKYVERLSVDDNAAKSFNILATSLNVLYNYHVLLVQTKLFSDLYLVKSLDISAKSFFPCK